MVGKIVLGDNVPRVRYFVRYIYDEDDDGYPADIDYDDENPLLTLIWMVMDLMFMVTVMTIMHQHRRL